MSSNVLIEALQNPALYNHPVDRFAIIETHISWVLLTGPFAYKIKKPVDLGFLDFTTLESRHHYCEEELRLNRRLAPELYRGVVPICGTPEAPRLGKDGEPFEYALRMVEFPQEALLDAVLRSGELSWLHIDALAVLLSKFHSRTAVAPVDSPYGEPDLVFQPVRENFLQIAPLLKSDAATARLSRLREWSVNRFTEQRTAFARRKRDGRVRECHGDMHLGNLVLFEGRITAFDCIEFSAALRWIDIFDDIAFLRMDLFEHGADPFAWRLLDRYLERTGDYEGLEVLTFYQVHRAMVRLKISALDGDTRHVDHYLQLAERMTRERPPYLLLTHGLSGSGKTVLSTRLVEHFGLVRVRSDIERKRMFGREADSTVERYSADATQRTYGRLRAIAATALASGLPIVVDATFLQHAQRALFIQLAEQAGVPCAILDLKVPEAMLATRIMRRLALGSDASEADIAVLDVQLQQQDPLTTQERRFAIEIDATDNPDLDVLRTRLVALGIEA